MSLSKKGICIQKSAADFLSIIFEIKRKVQLEQLDFHGGLDLAGTPNLDRELELILREIESKKSKAITIVHGFQKC